MKQLNVNNKVELAPKKTWWGLQGLGWMISTIVLFRVPPLPVKVIGLAGVMWFGTQLISRLRQKKFYLSTNELLIKGRMLLSKNISLQKIDKIEVKNEQGTIIGRLEKMDFERLRDIKEVSAIILYWEKHSLEIKRFQYEDLAYNDFVNALQAYYKEQHLPIEEKIKRIQQRCDLYLQKDRQLIWQLEENMFEAYNSIYKLHLTKKSLPSDKVIFHRKKDNTILYFLKEDFKPETRAEHIELANNLINAAISNVEIVKTRVVYYESISQALQSKRKSMEQFSKLKEIANRLNTLQAENIEKQQLVDLYGENTIFNTELLVLLEELTQKVHQIETIEKSYLLNEYIKLLKEDFIMENEVLRKLNQKLD